MKLLKSYVFKIFSIPKIDICVVIITIMELLYLYIFSFNNNLIYKHLILVIQYIYTVYISIIIIDSQRKAIKFNKKKCIYIIEFLTLGTGSII